MIEKNTLVEKQYTYKMKEATATLALTLLAIATVGSALWILRSENWSFSPARLADYWPTEIFGVGMVTAWAGKSRFGWKAAEAGLEQTQAELKRKNF